jgi:flagellin
MSLTILNNISSLTAENALSNTQSKLQNTLTQLSTGLKVNTGADDAAGLSIANGMQANINALTQSQQNVQNGVGLLQTADGALSQVTNLLNRAVTLATEASTDGLSAAQSTALDNEFKSINSEIDQISAATNFNGTQVFGQAGATNTVNVFISDGVASGPANAQIATNITDTSSTKLGTNADVLTSTAAAQTALGHVMTAINTVASARGDIGASINRLNAASSDAANTVQNLQSAENGVVNADIGKTVANMTQYNVLQSTGMAALQQSNQAQQAVLKLVQ